MIDWVRGLFYPCRCGGRRCISSAVEGCKTALADALVAGGRPWEMSATWNRSRLLEVTDSTGILVAVRHSARLTWLVLDDLVRSGCHLEGFRKLFELEDALALG